MLRFFNLLAMAQSPRALALKLEGRNSNAGQTSEPLLGDIENDGTSTNSEPIFNGEAELPRRVSIPSFSSITGSWADQAGNGNGMRVSPEMLSMVGASGGLLFGYDVGGVGSVLLQMKQPEALGGLSGDELTDSEQSAIVSTMLIGASLGAILGAYLNFRIGRRGVLIAASGTYVVGVGFVTVAGFIHNFNLMLFARVVCGFAVGFSSSTTPLYLSECAHKEKRGRMIFLNDVCIVIGQCLAASVSSIFVSLEIKGGWRYVLLGGAVPAIMMFLLFFFQMPESPRWLVKKGRIDEARTVLQSLRADEGDGYEGVEGELDAITAEVQREQRSDDHQDLVSSENSVTEGGGGYFRDLKSFAAPYFRDKRIYRPLRLGCILQTVQQWVGINAVMLYGATILSKSGNSEDDDDGGEHDPFSRNNKVSVYLTIPLAAAQMLGILGSMQFVDKLGRRPAIFGSLAVCCLALCSLGFAFSYENASTAAVVSIMIVYLISFGAGLSPVPWTVNSEIYPLQHRGTCMSIATATNWMMCFFTSISFLTLSTALSTVGGDENPNGVFWLYGAIALGALCTLYLIMPETKGKSLEEVGELFLDREERSLISPVVRRSSDSS